MLAGTSSYADRGYLRWPVGSQVAVATGGLSVSLADDSGSPVAGASVAIRKKPWASLDSVTGPRRPALPGPNETAFVTSDSNGHVAAPTLAPGDYLLCITLPPALGVISPCKWEGVSRLTVAAGQTTAPTGLVLHRGGVLRVHVTDAQHLLPTPDSLVMPAFSIGVQAGPGKFIGMKTSEQLTAVGRDYTMTVPFNTSLQFVIFSKTLRFADQSGTELLNGGNVPVKIPSGQAGQDITISVIGSKPL